MKKLIIPLFIIACVLCGCRKEQEEPMNNTKEFIDYSAENTMLFQYYSRITGTPMEMPFERICIFTRDEEHLLLEICREGGTDEEHVWGYLIPTDAYEQVLETIIQYRMDRWEEEEGYPIDGEICSVVFMLQDGMHSASSEYMPDDGFKAFSAVESKAYSFAKESSLLYDRYTDPDYERKKAEKLEGSVKDEEELLSYLKTVDLNRQNYQEYLELTTGMGMYDENHEYQEHLQNYVLLLMEPGYFPYTGMQGEYTCTVVKEGGESFTAQGKFNAETNWGYDEGNRCFRAHPTVYSGEDIGSIRDPKLTNIKGQVVCFDVPKDLLHEDDYGTYFYYRGKELKYYLNGYTGYVDSEGEYTSYRDLWIRDVLYGKRD